MTTQPASTIKAVSHDAANFTREHATVDIPNTALCGDPDCRHPRSVHEMYGCMAPYSGPGPAIGNAVCTCELFNDRAFIDRAARIDELKQLKAEFVEYDERHERSPDTSLSADEVAEWIQRKIAELEAQQ